MGKLSATIIDRFFPRKDVNCLKNDASDPQLPASYTEVLISKNPLANF